MTKILCAMADANDCISWWRGFMPLFDLQKRYGVEVEMFDFMANRSVGWHTIEACDVLYMSRPFLRDHMTVLGMAKKAGKAVWLDYDDDYWQIPAWNAAHGSFTPQALATLAGAAVAADVITVSTETLSARLRTMTDAPVHVVPNGFPDRYKWPTKGRTKTVLYRGGWRTHSGDLRSVAADFQGVINDHPDWTFLCVTQGHPVLVDGPNVQFMGDIAVPDFHLWLRETGASVMVNPLEFTDFNRAKSNIAWMEGTLAGAAVLAPAMPQYDEAGCTLYDQGEFGDALRRMFTQDHATRVAMSQETVDAKFRLSVVNEKRAAILSGLGLPTASRGGRQRANPVLSRSS